jgi:hypothetical protein
MNMTKQDIEEEIARRRVDLSSFSIEQLIALYRLAPNRQTPKAPKVPKEPKTPRTKAPKAHINNEDRMVGRLRNAIQRIGPTANARDLMRAANIYRREDYDRVRLTVDALS